MSGDIYNLYRGKDQKERGVNENPGCFYISSSLQGPFRVYQNIEIYKNNYKKYNTDFECIPVGPQVCIYIDIDIDTADDVESEVMELIHTVKKELNKKQGGIDVRWI